MKPFALRAILLSVAFCALAPAQVAEVSVAWKKTAFSEGDLGQVGLIPQTFELQDGAGVNLHFSVNGASRFGHELTYGYERDKLLLGSTEQGSVQVHKFFYDFVVHLVGSGERVRPFVLGGAGFASFLPPSEAAIQASNLTNFGVNFGGGVKVRLHQRLGLRFDIRDHLVAKPNFFDLAGVEGRVHSLEFGAGFSLLF